MEVLEIVGGVSSRFEEDGEDLYGKVGFARQFVRLMERAKAVERARDGRMDETRHMVGRDLEVLRVGDGKWRVPEVRVACRDLARRGVQESEMMRDD